MKYKFCSYLPSVILVLIIVNVKTLIILEQARRRLTWSLRATWCPWAPHWWPLGYRLFFQHDKWREWNRTAKMKIAYGPFFSVINEGSKVEQLMKI